MTELVAWFAGMFFALSVLAVTVLLKMATDLSTIRKIAQVYEVRADQNANREYRSLKVRIERRAELGELAERIVRLAGTVNSDSPDSQDTGETKE